MNALNQVIGELVLVPAYGRQYTSVALMLAAWEEGIDFKVFNGPYCSIRNLTSLRNSASRIVLTKDFFEYTVV